MSLKVFVLVFSCLGKKIVKLSGDILTWYQFFIHTVQCNSELHWIWMLLEVLILHYFIFVFPGGKYISICDYKDLGLTFLSSRQFRSKKKSFVRSVKALRCGVRELLIRTTEVLGDVKDDFCSGRTITAPQQQAETFLSLSFWMITWYWHR